MHVKTRTMIKLTRDDRILNLYLDQAMRMVGNSCKTSSKRICIDMQNHMDP